METLADLAPYLAVGFLAWWFGGEAVDRFIRWVEKEDPHS